MTRSSKASNVLGSSFHLGTTELSRIVIVATLHWISNAPLPMLELFSSRISVDQDLSVIVAEIDTDDDVKQKLVSIVFHASVTQQRSSGSKTRISCSHVHGRPNSCPPFQTRAREKKEATQTDAENRKNSGDVEELYPTPHIHEQMTAYIMATSTTTLSTTR